MLKKEELRKKSMHEFNIFGKDHKKFEKLNIDETIYSRLQNAIDEFLYSSSLTDIKKIVEETIDKEFQQRICASGTSFCGLFVINPKQFPAVYKLVLILFKEAYIAPSDIEVGLMIVIINFYNTLIDNPNSSLIFCEMVAKFKKVKKFLSHIKELQLQIEYASRGSQHDEEKLRRLISSGPYGLCVLLQRSQQHFEQPKFL
eukprot:TRINITY_DN8166_c0_g1_i2.p2 TRINITY_DN8166_c0_g1~~TRINITY_DN8166_c0_g1_i2.p2  ORF type:complete len:201 (-),score=15.58 TRINITY_DN8166_c0_g1_i2:432-1034(-)